MNQQLSSLEENSSGSITWSPNDIYSQVMGKERHGRICGIGFGLTPSNYSGSTSNKCENLRMIS